MSVHKIFSIIILTIICFSSCDIPNNDKNNKDNDTEAASKFDATQFADEMCKCLKISHDYSENVKKLEQEEDKIAFEALIAQRDSIQEISNDCINVLEQNYGDIVDEKEAEIKASMEKNCPKIASFIK